MGGFVDISPIKQPAAAAQSAIEEVDANLVFQPPAPETPFIDINREIEKLVRD